jgi:hypothetical protein
MPWTVKWLDDDERVLVAAPVDPWTWEEFKDATQTAQALTKGKPYPVDLIYHLGDDLTLPKPPPGEHVAPWVPMRDVLMQQPANRGVVVVVAAPLFIESIVKNLKAVVRDQKETGNIRLVSNMDDARKILAER